MKKISMLLGTISLALVLFAGVSTALAAPDPLFFELKVSAKGYEYLDGEESKSALKTTVYMMYVWNGYYLAYQTQAGWELFGRIDVFPFDTDNSIAIVNHTTELNLTTDLPVFMILNARIVYKAKDGDVVKAKLTSVGAMVYGDRIISGATFYGNGSIKGKMIPFEKFPPEVRALMIF
jgi:hypothetical protein